MTPRSKSLAALAVAAALAGCAAPAPDKPAALPSLAAVVSSDPGVVYRGKVVTLNAAGEVLADGRVWVRGGRIEAVLKAGEALPAGASGARVIDTGGAIYPGLIDLHNHPEYAIYPLMPVPRAYKDRYEWRWYDDAYNLRITNPNIVLAGQDYYNLALEIGRYGEYKALAGGTTTLQGGRANLPYSTSECLVRNIENSRVGEKLAVSRVDIGRDAVEWADLKKARDNGLLVVHLAEGPSGRMAGEYEAIKKSGLVGPELIAIHGVGLTEAQFKDMAKEGAKLVWSPLSNFLLYGKTADVAAAKRAGVKISIAPDWAPSGSKSVLGEIKVADLVNKKALNGLFSDRELVEMATVLPAEAMGWAGRAGRIAPGHVADLLVVDDRHADPYRNLVEAVEDDIRLVAVRGEALYGDAALLTDARGGDAATEEAVKLGARVKRMAPNCPATTLPVMSLATTRERLSRGLAMDAEFLRAQVEARPGAAAKLGAELARCPGGAPAATLSAADAARFLSCRFKLPYEKTVLSPLTVNEDPDWMARLAANPNLPDYVKSGLPAYYRR